MTGSQKQAVYAKEYSQYKKAMRSSFYVEAVSIAYNMIEDRLLAFFHHSGIISRTHQNLSVNVSVYPYIRRLLGKDDKYSIEIKKLSTKLMIIKTLLNMTEETSIRIDNEVNTYIQTIKRKQSVAAVGYMHSLFSQIKSVKKMKQCEYLMR